jgi:hypothetical protein
MTRLLLIVSLFALFVGCNSAAKAPITTVLSLEVPILLDQPSSDIIDAGSPAPDEVELLPPAIDEKPRNTIIQYTIKGCRWCDYDRERIIPQWVKNGWKFPAPIDESANPKGAYPRYEIYDANGVKKEHKGSLLSWKN